MGAQPHAEHAWHRARAGQQRSIGTCTVNRFTVDVPANSRSSDAAEFGQPLPRQAQHQGVELRGRERRGWRDAGGGRPDEAASVQAPRRAPHAEAVVNEQLDACAAAHSRRGSRDGLGDSNTCTTRASSRSVPARMSMGSAADHIVSMRIIEATRASRPRTRLRHLPAKSP